MYRPSQFREDRTHILCAAIHELGFATLITLQGRELVASHIPMILKQDAAGLRLEGHVARANPQWKGKDDAVDALAVFLGPHSYISPTWYATKAETQRVVPTWNYISVQASGPLSIIQDPQWLLRHVGDLTRHNEAARAKPWDVSDAPAEFIEQMCSAIVGLSMQVQRLEGSWKMAQHKPEPDRLGVIQGLQELGDDSAMAIAREMLRLEKERQ